MAKDQSERTYVIPLRKEFQKAPKYKRAKKAISAVRIFLKRHMKSDNIKLGAHLNEFLWSRGIKNPPHKVQVNVTKDSEGVVKAELIGAPKEETKDKKGKKKTEEKSQVPTPVSKDTPSDKKQEVKKTPVQTIDTKLTEEEKKKMDAKGPKAEIPKAADLAKK